MELLDQLSGVLTPQHHLSLMRRLQAVMRALSSRPEGDRQVHRAMYDYRYLRAEVLAGAQLDAVLAALERLLQGTGDSPQSCQL